MSQRKAYFEVGCFTCDFSGRICQQILEGRRKEARS